MFLTGEKAQFVHYRNGLFYYEALQERVQYVHRVNTQRECITETLLKTSAVGF